VTSRTRAGIALVYYCKHVDERGLARSASGALGAVAMVLAGCVAPILETRLEGPDRPTPDARSEVIVERRAGDGGTAECREVAATAPMVRDVVIRRSFIGDAQERNGALAMLLGAAGGVLAYGQGKAQCSQGGACGSLGVSAGVMFGLAAIPLGFLAYNAVAVRDRPFVERVAPEARPGPWRACSE
jgi:hypothetical protein